MRENRDRPAEAERCVLGDDFSVPSPPPTGEEMPPSTSVLRAFPSGSRHPGGVALVCPLCGSHHWLPFAADGVYSCPLGDGRFVADGGAA